MWARPQTSNVRQSWLLQCRCMCLGWRESKHEGSRWSEWHLLNCLWHSHFQCLLCTPCWTLQKTPGRLTWEGRDCCEMVWKVVEKFYELIAEMLLAVTCKALRVTLEKLLISHAKVRTDIFAARRIGKGDSVGYYELLVYDNMNCLQHLTKTYGQAFVQLTWDRFHKWAKQIPAIVKDRGKGKSGVRCACLCGRFHASMMKDTCLEMPHWTWGKYYKQGIVESSSITYLCWTVRRLDVILFPPDS